LLDKKITKPYTTKYFLTTKTGAFNLA
jgi:hypothetical protein